MKKIFYLLPVCLILLLSGCRPEGVLSPQEMTDLLADMYLTDGLIDAVEDGGRAWDSLDVYGPQLEAHGVTLPEFEASVEYYLHHPRDFSKIYDKVEEKLEADADRLEKLIAAAEEEGEESEETEERVEERRKRPVEGVEARIEREEENETVQEEKKTEDKKQDTKRRNGRKKLSKKELEELEKELKK